MTNFDEAILRGKLIQPTAPFPVLHQALRIALYDEYAARAYYAAVCKPSARNRRSPISCNRKYSTSRC